METKQTNSLLASATLRLALWGSAITGFAGWVLAVNAALGDEYTGAGVCLLASALGFGVIGYTFVRK